MEWTVSEAHVSKRVLACCQLHLNLSSPFRFIGGNLNIFPLKNIMAVYQFVVCVYPEIRSRFMLELGKKEMNSNYINLEMCDWIQLI